MKKINIVTIALFSIGIIFAILTGYNYFTSFHVISKQQAIDIAVKFGNWQLQKQGNFTTEADLLQAHLSNNVALVIDPKTMALDFNAKHPYQPLRSYIDKENQLFWEVSIKHFSDQYQYHEWIYDIDATNGTLIQGYTPYGMIYGAPHSANQSISAFPKITQNETIVYNGKSTHPS